MFENCEISPPPLSRKTRQKRYLSTNNSIETTSCLLQSRFCISRIINTTKKSFKGKFVKKVIIGITYLSISNFRWSYQWLDHEYPCELHRFSLKGCLEWKWNPSNIGRCVFYDKWIHHLYQCNLQTKSGTNY